MTAVHVYPKDMPVTRRPRLLLALASLPLVFSMAACSSADDDGDPESFADDGKIPAETVQSGLEDFLTDNEIVGTVASCKGIDDKVDASSTCTATIDEIEGEVPITVATSTDKETTFAYDLTEFGYEAQ